MSERVLGLAILTAILFVAGCGSTPAGQAVTLSTGATQAVDQGQTLNITATVANDTASKGVTWTFTGPGALSNQTTATATYSANGAAGTATITATSVADVTKKAILTVTVTAAPAITTTTLPAGVEGIAYSQAIVKTGGAGTGTFSVSAGTLPPGLTLSSSGTVSGTPTGPNGTANFTVKVTDSSTVTPMTVTQALSILINLPPAPSITTTTLPVGVEGTAYSQTVAATGAAPLAFSISAGTLPPGLVLSSAGVISGTPTGPNATSNFTVKVTDSSNPTQNATQALSILINLPAPPSITTTTLPAGVEGTAYSQTVVATGGLGSLTFSVSVGSLPAGLTMNSSGHISGTPTGPNVTSNFTVKITDTSNPVQSATKALSILINLPTAPTITPTTLPNGNVGTSYSQTLTVNNGLGPFTWSVSIGSLPAGLSLNGATGAISGTPTTVQSNVAFTIQVTDSSNPQQNGIQAYTVTIGAAFPLSVTTTSAQLSGGTDGTAYPATSLTASGGVQPYTWAVTGGTFPTGLTLSSAGAITGTPTATGTFNFTVTATDSVSSMANASLTITVAVACGTGSEALLTGQYAFMLKGFDSSGNPVLIGGVFTASGASGSSNLTAGVVDMNLSGGVQSNLAIASGSNYTVGSDGRGCMAITTSAGTQNYRFSLGASGNGHMIDFDAAGPFTTGVLRKQTASAFSTAQISGNYAFGTSSLQDTSGSKLAAMGVLNLSGGSVTGGSADYNYYNGGTSTVTLDGVSGATAWPPSPESINSGGSYSISGTTGRGTVSFTLSDGTPVNAYIYVVSANEMLMVSSGARSSSVAIFAGTAYKQSSTSYSTASLSGTSVFYDSKPSNNGTTATSNISIGIVTTTGTTGTFSYAGYSNSGGNIQTPTNNSASGTFTVASNGRVTLAAGGGGGGNQTPEFYLFSPGSAFGVFSGNGADDGLMESQSATSAANGTYATGTIDPQTAGVSDKVGVATLTSGSATATDDSNSHGSLSPNSAGTNTYSVDPTGVIFLPASCTPGTNCEKIGAVVSSSKIVLMDAKSSSAGGSTNPGLQDVDQ